MQSGAGMQGQGVPAVARCLLASQQRALRTHGSASPGLLHPYLVSEMAILERTIHFLYLINPLNPRSFTRGQKVGRARVASSLRPGWSLCGRPLGCVSWVPCRLCGSADRPTQLRFWLRLQLTSLSDEIAGSVMLAHLLGCMSLPFTANLRYLPYKVKISGLS